MLIEKVKYTNIMKNIFILFFISLGFITNAQEVISNGTLYEVRDKAIFKDGINITDNLLEHERAHIFKAQKNHLEEAKKAEKLRKKLEKSAKKAEKSQKKAEKELKKRKKAQNDFSKASKKLKDQQENYEKLKNKGKLSPNDESKWHKKLEGYKKDVEKSKRKIDKL